LGFRDRGFRHLETVAQVAEGFVVAAVDVELFRRHLELDGLAAVTHGGAEVGVDYVVAFGAPGDVVRVAKGVDLQSADVGGEEHEVGCGAGEHVPRVEVEEGHEEVDTDRGASRDDEVGEDIVTETEVSVTVFQLTDHDVDAGEGIVCHDYGIDYHRGEVQFLGSLGSIAHGEDKLRADEEDAGVTEDGEDVETKIMTKGVDGGVGERASNEVEGQVEVGEGEVGEE
jgi:hypothetical protein